MFLEMRPSSDLFALFNTVDGSKDKKAFLMTKTDLDVWRQSEPIPIPPVKYEEGFAGYLYDDEGCLENGVTTLDFKNIAVGLDLYWENGIIVVSERLLAILDEFEVPLFRRKAIVRQDGVEFCGLAYHEIVIRAFRPAFDFFESGTLVANRQMRADAAAGRRCPMPIHLFGHVVWNPPFEIEEAFFREAYSNRILASRDFASAVEARGMKGIAFCEMRTEL